MSQDSHGGGPGWKWPLDLFLAQAETRHGLRNPILLTTAPELAPRPVEREVESQLGRFARAGH